MTTLAIRTRPGLRVTLFAVLCLASFLGRPAAGQSPAELRRENQRLAAENESLRAELAAATAEIERLRALVETLRAAGESPEETEPRTEPVGPAVTIDEDDPRDSPRAMLEAVRAAYRTDFADREIGENPRGPERRAYLAALERWITGVETAMRDGTTWHLEATGEPPVPIRGGIELKVVAVDPVTRAVLGPPFHLVLDRRAEDRLRRLERTGAIDRAGGTFVVTGEVRPFLYLAPDRRTPGIFDNPPLVGAFVEFDMQLKAESITLPAAVEPGEASGAGAGTGAGAGSGGDGEDGGTGGDGG